MEEHYKIIDTNLYKYVCGEVGKRYPDAKFWQNNAYKQHSVVEDRVFTITFPDKRVIKYHQGRATLILDTNMRIQATEDEKIKPIGDIEFLYEPVISQKDVGYSRAEADVLDAILYLIRYYEKIAKGTCTPQNNNTIQHDNEEENDEVTLKQMSLNDIFNPQMNLSIPDYQRIYCWGKEQVTTLLHDIKNISTKKYFLGNIILHKRNDEGQKKEVLDIVDGQQRLVTLALIHHFTKEDNDEECGLLNCTFLSVEAQQHVYDNAQIIQEYLKDGSRKQIKDNLSKLSFGVLTIDQEHLDLAFTFFTNTNSRGKLLTDYDLLKPHHLRYIPSDYQLQQQALATQWDKMINRSKKLADNPNQRRDAPYIHVLELILYRLRKWSRKKDCDETDRFVYTEYKTAKIIEEIPPFGENFDFFEPIQGGQHFFEYVEHFMQKYLEFTSVHEVVQDNQKDSKEGIQLNVYDVLRENFTGYSDRWYRYVMEALAFCYYLKFGNSFLSEATLSIVRYVSKIRFDKAKAYEPTIVKYARDSEIVLMIEQATSPTFFLAEIESEIERLPKIENFGGVRASFLESCRKVSEYLSEKSSSVSYKNYFKKRYERITSK